MHLEKNWVHFAKNMIGNVSRETCVRFLSALRGFLGSFLPSTSIPSCLLSPLFPVSLFSARRKVARKAFSLHTWAGCVQSGHMAEHGCLVHMYFRRDEPKKWPKKQTADLTAEQRQLALRLPAKTSRSIYLHTSEKRRQNWHDKSSLKKCGCQQKSPLKKCGCPQK